MKTKIFLIVISTLLCFYGYSLDIKVSCTETTTYCSGNTNKFIGEEVNFISTASNKLDSIQNAKIWFQKNATWIFNYQRRVPNAITHGYRKYAVSKDTVINDTTAKIISIKSFSYTGHEFVDINLLFVYESNSRVYWWNGNQFKLMYDFNLNAGDTLDVDIERLDRCDSVSPIIINSISNINLNGHNLKVQHVSYSIYAENFGGKRTIHNRFIERIGSEQRFIFSPRCIFDESFTYEGLRCYSDDSIFYKSEWWASSFPGAACDSSINKELVNIEKVEEQGGFLVFPNPTNDFVTISNKNSNTDNFYIELYNSSGAKLDRISGVKTATIDLSNYQSGLYFIKIYQESKMNYTFKIIKN